MWVLYFQVVEKLDTPEVYINYLTTLGRKHIMYEAEPELLDQIGYLFLTSIKAILEREVKTVHDNYRKERYLNKALHYKLFFVKAFTKRLWKLTIKTKRLSQLKSLSFLNN